MAVCVDCGTNKTFERSALRCSACQAEIDAAEAAAGGSNDSLAVVQLSPSMCVTTQTLPGYTVQRSVGIVTAECALGMNIFRDLAAGMTDVFGGRSVATQSVLRDARVTCLRELRTAAMEQGGNAVVGVRLDYSEFSGGGKSMPFLVASGTALVADPVGDFADAS